MARRRNEPGLTLTERIRALVEVSDTGCWVWTAYLTPDGYGRIQCGAQSLSAHRTSYTAFVGPIPEGLELDHLCRNTACVNPEHLEPVTTQENIRRRQALLTHCKNGHPFSPENTYLWGKRNERCCRTCNREAQARYKARRRAEVGALS